MVWRDGDHRVFDAYCPHLGAHLGVGGRVEDGCLVCPFHEWTFGPDGTNAAIPYADRPNRKARVRSYPTMVRNGLLLFWHHPDPEVEPAWDVPQALTDDHVEVGRETWTVRTAWQEIAENSVDMAHFRSVVSSTTPVDLDHVEVRFTLYHSGDEIAAKIGAGFAAEVSRQFHEDIPICENKRYQPTPALAPSERPVTEFRRWAAQFYPEPSP